MVFDWFKRSTASGSGEGSVPGEEQEASAASAGQPPEPEPNSIAEPEFTPQAVVAAATAVPAAVPGPAPGAVDEDALAWARQAYARLKAQQAQPPASEVLPSELPSEAASEAPTESAAVIPQAAPAPLPEPPVPPEPPAAAPAPSLLEQAAAQRLQRLEELVAPTPTPEPEFIPAVRPEQPAGDEAEPQLGAFDEDFTWSAEVLAAQGRSVEDMSVEEIDWLGRLRRGLEKTRRGFVTQLLDNLGEDPLTPEVLDDLETTLLRADVGVQATDQVLEALRRRLNEEVVDPTEGIRFLKQQLRGLLDAPITASGEPLLAPQRDRLNVWLMVGVNGVGKTTTLGKLANLAVRSGYSCLIAAADTFRAAAVQQVTVWGERSGVPVIANPSSNADPAAVVYDAIGAARAKGTELVLVDTAGRLQTKHNLMEELSKVRRIIDKLAPEAVVESLLVLDASQGQNGLRQAMAFASAAGLTGVVLTKLDGSARGGVALAVASEAGLPIRFVGAGEGIRDLRPFNSFEFVEALLAG